MIRLKDYRDYFEIRYANESMEVDLEELFEIL